MCSIAGQQWTVKSFLGNRTLNIRKATLEVFREIKSSYSECTCVSS